MLQKLQNNPIITIALVVVIMLGFSIDSLSVSIMEARNFITAREMLTDGNWLLTTMNGEARYEKPPLPTWLTAISASVFGIKSLLALRFPAILFIIIIGVFTYLLSKQLLGHKSHSFFNALIVITSFYVVGITIEAPWDIFTHGFMLMGIYYLFQFLEANSVNYKHCVIAGICIGCSILCKGPISIYALLLPFLISYGFIFKYKNLKSKLLPFIGIIIVALSIGGWWYLYVRLNDAETFTAIAERETSNWSNYNVKPFYYYWSFFIQSGIWTIPAFISLLYPYLKTRVRNLKAYQFSLLWTLVVLILLSIIPEKKSRYLMPILIPLAINIGFYIDYLILNFKTITDKRETLPVYFNFGLIAGIGILFPLISYWLFGEALTTNWLAFSLASIVTFTIGLLIIFNLKRKRIKHVFLLTVFFFAALLLTVLPLSKVITSTNYKSIAHLKEEASQSQVKIYGLNYVSPEMIWQFGDKIPSIKRVDGQLKFPNEPKFGLLANGIKPKDQEHIKMHYNIEEIATYDLNQASPESSNYNGRLMNHYYILTKKSAL